MAGRTGLSRHHTMKRSTASVHIVVTCLGTACHHMEPNRDPASQPAAAPHHEGPCLNKCRAE